MAMKIQYEYPLPKGVVGKYGTDTINRPSKLKLKAPVPSAPEHLAGKPMIGSSSK